MKISKIKKERSEVRKWSEMEKKSEVDKSEKRRRHKKLI